ncbi:MAG: hypothetical protein AAF938_27920 [Myxococcota bacterium]
MLVAFGALRAAPERAIVWHDEVFTQVFASGRSGDDWLPLFDGVVRPIRALQHARTFDRTQGVAETAAGLARDEPQHPPLYYAAARAWTSLNPTTFANLDGGLYWLRWLSVLSSLLALLGVAWLGRELAPSRALRRVLPLLFAVSPVFVLFSLEAREYALWVAAFAASSAALLRARRTRRRMHYALYAFLMATCFYVSLSSLSIALAHTLYVVWNAARSRSRAGLVAFALCGAGALPLFAPWAHLLVQNWDALAASTAWMATIEIPRAELLGTFGLNLGRTFFDNGADALGQWGGLIIVLTLVPPLAWLTRALRKGEDAARFALCLFAGPVLLLLMPDLLAGGIRSVSTRYLLPSLLALLVMAAFAIARRPKAAAALLVLMAGSSIFITQARAPWTKGLSTELPAIAAEINAHAEPLIVVDHERHHPGNMLALCGLLAPDAFVQLLPTVEDYALPPHPGPVFLFSPNPRFVDELAAQRGRPPELLVEHLHASLWRVR